MKKHINTVPFRRFLYYAQSFNQDLSGWCVTNITSEPGAFALLHLQTLTNPYGELVPHRHIIFSMFWDL